MPITLSKIAANTASVIITNKDLFGDESVTVTYYPGKITDRMVAHMEEMESVSRGNRAGLDSLNDVLCELIHFWEVLEDDGTTMFPLQPERLKELPIAFKSAVLWAMIEDMRPNGKAPQMTPS